MYSGISFIVPLGDYTLAEEPCPLDDLTSDYYIQIFEIFETTVKVKMLNEVQHYEMTYK